MWSASSFRHNELVDPSQQSWSGRITREAAFSGEEEILEAADAPKVATSWSDDDKAAPVVTAEAAGRVPRSSNFSGLKPVDAAAVQMSAGSGLGTSLLANGTWRPISAGAILGAATAPRMPSDRPHSAAATVEASQPVTFSDVKSGRSAAALLPSESRPGSAAAAADGGMSRPNSGALKLSNSAAVGMPRSRPGSASAALQPPDVTLARTGPYGPAGAEAAFEAVGATKRESMDPLKAVKPIDEAARSSHDGRLELDGDMTASWETSMPPVSTRHRHRYALSGEQEEGSNAEEEEEEGMAGFKVSAVPKDLSCELSGAGSNVAALLTVPPAVFQSSKEIGEQAGDELLEDAGSVEAPAATAAAEAPAKLRHGSGSELLSYEQEERCAALSAAEAMAAGGAMAAAEAMAAAPRKSRSDDPDVKGDPLRVGGPTTATDTDAYTDIAPAGGGVTATGNDTGEEEHEDSDDEELQTSLATETTEVVPFTEPGDAKQRRTTDPRDG
ncbi:hypothetical protein VaNZ11_011802 [Volvox africanus]|uniref:Uncharacterized protein n=1 Tax=Volvox africanus TaxID=51714 RepID=A0ABQ5SDM2_9CHLO|nr:hypothetical protein VaNZ11_011802 [Volvox africanus]